MGTVLVGFPASAGNVESCFLCCSLPGITGSCSGTAEVIYLQCLRPDFERLPALKDHYED